MPAVLVASLSSGPVFAAPEPSSTSPASAATKSVPVGKVPVQPAGSTLSPTEVLSPPSPIVVWPKAGSAVVPVASAVGATIGATVDRRDAVGVTSVSGLPVSVRRASDRAAGVLGDESSPSSVRVSVAGREVAQAAGIAGVVFSLSRADGSSVSAQVALDVEYTAFQNAYGGDYAGRLTLVTLPACVLETPDLHRCQMRSPLPGVRRVHTSRTVSADSVPVAGDGSSVFAIAPLAAGDGGSFASTDMSLAYSWAAGSNGGDFSLNYPFKVPPSLGGPAPELALRYNSGASDAMTYSRNGQVSPVGEGWGFDVGYIEQSYRGCRDDWTNTGDLCQYAPYNATIVWGGKSTPLVRDSAGVWRAGSDDAWRIERLVDASVDNGDFEREYWKVTTLDGTQYFFGKHKRHAGDTEVTNSVQQVPVIANHPGEFCFSQPGSWCQQAYRWNLDYVVDPRGNSMTYYWSKFRGKYGYNNNFTVMEYDLSAKLEKIEYGTRAGLETPGTAPMRVVFTHTERCFDSPCDPADFFDTPMDIYCPVTATSCPNTLSPVYFSKHRLTNVTTEVRQGSAYKAVDGWWLQQSVMFSGDFIPPFDGKNESPPNLWLHAVHHYGFAADGTTTGEPPTTFTGTLMPNRVHWGADLGISPYPHARITSVDNGVGGKTVVNYHGADCQPSERPHPVDPVNNFRRCFQQFTRPLVAPSDWIWFNKYVIESIVEKDLVGGSPDETWHYGYSWTGSSSNVMWHMDNSETTPLAYRNWSDWRGYPTVTTTHGATGGPQSVTVERFYRGMHGDRTASGWNTRAVTINDSQASGILDHEALAGFVRERTVMDATTVASSDIHEPTTTLTGTRPAYEPGVEGQEAYRYRETKTTKRVALEGGSWRTTVTDTTYDATYGLPTSISDWGEAGNADNVCTDITYAPANAPNYMRNYRSRELVHTCVAAGSRTDADYLKITDFLYDGATSSTTMPTKGLLTQTTGVKSVVGGVRTWASLGKLEYDDNGRVKKVYDGINRATSTAYTPASGGPVTQTVVTNPAGHTTTTAFDFKGNPTTVTDANGKVSTVQYDKLARVTKVWLPGRATSLTGNMEFVYDTPGTAPASIANKQLGPNGNQVVSYHVFDGRLRLRQTQGRAPQANGGRMIADTVYDGRGLVAKESSFWNNTSGPTNSLVAFADTAVLDQRRFAYDNLGRKTVDASWSANALKWQTTFAYSGNWTSVTPPAGGTASKTYFDANGNTTSLRQYVTPTPTTTQYQTTSYTHDRLGKLKTVTDPSLNNWSYGYDLLGRVMTSGDPDRGTVNNMYDDAGQLLTTADARPTTLSYDYDSLGRRRSVWQGAVTTGTKLAEWTYDTLASGTSAKGQLATATRILPSGQYKTEVTGYDDVYRPLGATTKVPLGQAGVSGDWTVSTTYKADGSLASTTFPAAGGLPAETVNYTYDDTGTLLTVAGLSTYVSGTSYHPWGDVYQRLLGTGTKRVRLTTTVDEATGRLTANQAQTENQTTPNTWNYALTENYGYDHAGNVKSINEVNSTGGTVANQCFNYDPFRQLTEAWTTAASTCQATPSQSVVGGSDQYWTSYSYSAIGNRATEVKHTTAGNTTRTYTYPAPGATSVRPHAVTSVASTGAATGTDTYTYDNLGNALTRNIAGKPGQTLTWTPQGNLATVTDTAGTTSYIYDASGTRLIETRPGNSATLYLPGMEVERAAGGAITATRHYGVATRTTSGGLTWLAVDHHGTSQLAINSTSLATTRRKSDPFGNSRGADPAWPNSRGFVNGVKDGTGLTHLGAREYEPTTGRFLSVDAIMDVRDPQQMHGYTYANNNPISLSDPTGQDPCPGGGGGCYYAGTTTYLDGVTEAQMKAGQQQTQTHLNELKKIQVPISPHLAMNPSDPRFDKMKAAYDNALKTWFNVKPENLSVDTELLIWKQICNNSPGLCGAELTQLLNEILPFPGIYAPDGSGIGDVMANAGSEFSGGRTRLRGGRPTLAGEGAPSIRRAGGACINLNSFVPGTLVQMADGSGRPVEDVRVGDYVLATDPETGRTVARPVVGLITGTGDKTLVHITTDTGRLTATDGHPFWSPDRREWVKAIDLRQGDRLRTPFDYVRVVDTATSKISTTVHNLTVADLHTYYVWAGNVPVLVHNTGPCGSGLTGASDGLRNLYADGGIRGKSIVGIRSKLLDDGFRQELTRNRQGYLFTNGNGEEVRIMRRNNGWDVRVRNQHGNYLDEAGNVAPPGRTHGIEVHSR